MTQTNSNHKVGRLLIVDDETELMTALCEILTRHGYETIGCTSAAEALAKLKEQDFDLLLTDLMMPEMGGIELLQAALAIDPNIVGIIMTGQGTVQTAVEAMKTGAFDYILKPFNLNSLLPVLSRAMEVRYLRTENIQLRNTVAMHELGQALAFSSDLNQILNKVIDAVMQQCDADEASIMLPTSDGRDLIVAVARGGHTEHVGKQIPMGQGIAGWVAQNRETVTLSGEVHDERFTLINPRADIRAAVSFPLLTRNNLVGVLNVNIIHSHRPFTLGQIKTLNMLATIVSPILENARLYAEKKRAEEIYRTLAEGSFAAVFIVQDGKFRFINAAVKSMGYSPEDLIDRHSDAIIHPEDKEMVKKRSGEMLRGEHTAPYEYRMVTKQGEIKWLMQIISPILYEGRPAIMGNATDITEIKKMEEKERESEKKYRDLYDFLPIPVYEMDLEANIISANRAIYETFGATEEDLKKGFKVWQILSPEEIDKANENIQRLLKGEQVRGTEYTLLRLDGSVFPAIVISSVIYSNGHPVGIRGAIVDITERKQLEEALRNSQTRLHTLLQTIPDLIWLKDKDGVYLSCNTMFERFFGAREADIIGRTDYDFMDRELADFFRGHDRNAMAAGKPTSNEEWITFADDGHRAFLDTIKMPMYDAQGTLIGVLGIGRDITERKQAEENLKKNKILLDSVFSAIQDLILIVDKDLKVLISNWKSPGYTGNTKCPGTPHCYEAFIHRDIPCEPCHALEVFATGKTVLTEYFNPLTERFSDIRAYPIFDSNNQVIMVAEHVRDITERKQAEEALRIQNRTFSEVLNGLDALVYVVDMKTYEIIFINTYGQNIWGDIKGKICWQTIQEGQAGPCEFCTNSQLIGPDGNPTKGIAWEFRNTVAKRWYDCRDKAIYWPDGRIVRMEIATDITERKQAEEELRSYAAEISDLYNNAPCGYHSLGPDGAFLRMNDSELQWLGYTRDEIIGKKHFSDILTPKSRQLFQEIYPVFKERGWAGNLEFDEIRKDGSIFPVLMNATAVKDENGNYIMSRTTTIDNTERKRTEEELGRYREHLEAMVGIRTNELELKNAELEETRLAAVSANQAKSDFLASMSHELRTPLNAIIGFSDVLLNAYFGALNEKQKEYTMDILESGKHLLNLINDVLDISKVEAGKMELELAPTEIGNLLASCVVMIKEKTHKHGIDLKVDIPEELLSLEMLADQRKVKQIMFNLLSNAAKFTPDGGAITLSALHRLQEGNDVLEVSVTDAGIGIPPEYQEKIFESFYQIRGGLTDKTPGTGLGLSVAKQLVELHGGGIRLKSDGRGKGSRFSFTLPVKAIDEKTYHSVRKAKARSKAKIDGA